MSSCVRNQLSENRSLLINSATTRHTGSGQALTCSLNPFPISPGSFIKNVAGPKTRRLFLSHQSLRVSTLLCSQVPVSRTRVGVSDRRAPYSAVDLTAARRTPLAWQSHRPLNVVTIDSDTQTSWFWREQVSTVPQTGDADADGATAPNSHSQHRIGLEPGKVCWIPSLTRGPIR